MSKKIITFLFIINLGTNLVGFSQTWSAYGAGFIYSNVVYDLIEYNGQLHASGTFNGSGSSVFKGIGKWNGTFWETLGGGSNGGGVLCMVIYNGDLIVAGGGGFNSMGNVPGTKGIARWDGNSWHALGAGLTFGGQINCMTVYDGKLYIGGNFQQIDSMSMLDIAVWDGTFWSSPCVLSGGLTELRAMEVFNNELYIGGYLGSVNGITCYNIAKFDGQTWGPVGDGLNSGVFSLYSDTLNNRLFAAGNFGATAVGTVLCPSNIACWDGNNWNAFGTTVSQLYPREICIYKGEVYAGTQSRSINTVGDTLNAIARWDGNDWQALGNGLMADTFVGSCWALMIFNDKLTVGGVFNKAGSISASLIAEWDYTPVGISEFGIENDKILIYPNPFGHACTVKLPEDYLHKLPVIFELYNTAGKRVLQKKVRSIEFEIARENLRSGMYVYRLLGSTYKQFAEGNIMIE